MVATVGLLRMARKYDFFRKCTHEVRSFLILPPRNYLCGCCVRVVGEDDFFADLGISYKDFDMPDEVDDYYEAKENPDIASDS